MMQSVPSRSTPLPAWRRSRAGTLSALAATAASLMLFSADVSAQTVTITNLWSISPLEGRPYLTNATATSYTERGVAYNPVNNHAYIVSRQGGVKVAILDGDNGAELGYLNVSGITGGTFALSTISVADDGAIYAANLTTGSASSPYKIYRWADETSAPVVVFSGNPSLDLNHRYGESLDVRGAGLNTEIIASANAQPYVAIFRPADETLATFNASRIQVSGIGAGDLTKGIGFGPTNTFFGKNNGVTAARHCVYDLATGTGSVLASYTVATGIAPLDADPANQLLAGVETANALTPHNLRVYDISGGSAVLIHTAAFPAPSANNGNLVGQVQIAGNRIFAIDAQNGVIMSKILVDTNVAPPTITAPPIGLTIVEGGYAALTVAATGTRPLSYEWSLNGTPIPGANTNVLLLTNVTAGAAGTYTVRVTNRVDSASADATVAITPTPLNNNLRVLWKLAPGSRPYLSSDNNQRGLAVNPVSGNVLLASRTPTNGIHVLDAATGAFKYSMNLGSGLIAGGAITLNMLGCADDGQVFACNVTTDGTGTSKLRVYGWLDDGQFEAPYLAWEGDPGAGVAHRWGDSFDVRGSGLDVEILVASRNGRLVSIIRPGFGAGSPANVIDVTDADPGNFGLSVKWGPGFTFYGKAAGASLRHVAYDPSTLLASTVAVNTSYPNMSAIGYDPASGLMSGISREIPDNLRLLNGARLAAGEVALDTEFYLTDNLNDNGTGQIAMRGRKVFALQSNNGIIAAAYGPTLRVSLSGTALKLEWDGVATLEGAPAIGEAFTEITGAASGVTFDVNAAGGPRYFRLRE